MIRVAVNLGRQADWHYQPHMKFRCNNNSSHTSFVIKRHESVIFVLCFYMHADGLQCPPSCSSPRTQRGGLVDISPRAACRRPHLGTFPPPYSLSLPIPSESQVVQPWTLHLGIYTPDAALVYLIVLQMKLWSMAMDSVGTASRLMSEAHVPKRMNI